MGLIVGEENNVDDEEGILKPEVENIDLPKDQACLGLPNFEEEDDDDINEDESNPNEKQSTGTRKANK